jgi:sugar phosphate permease
MDVAKKSKKAQGFLIFSAFFLYILFIGVKNVYTAEIALIQLIFKIDKPTASMTTTYYFFTYCATQVLLFLFMRKFNLKIFLTITLGIASLLMFSVGFCPENTIVPIYVVYAIGGVFQAGLWAGIVAILSMYLPGEKLAFANKIMAIGMPVAGGISYGFSSIFNSFGNWNLPFIILGALAFLAVGLFYFAILGVEKIPREKVAEGKKQSDGKKVEYKIFNLDKPIKRIGFYVVVLALCLLTGSLYFGITNWIPSLMVDIYKMPQATATLITTIVPLSIVLGSIVVIDLCERYKNTMLIGAICFSISLVLILYLIFFYNLNLIVTLIVLVLLLNIVNGGRNIFSSILAFKMRAQINAGGLAAISNAFSSLGAGFAPTIVGAIIEVSGWQVSYITLFGICAVTVGVLVVLTIMVNNNLRKQK